jgi:putative phage-type endonuclease
LTVTGTATPYPDRESWLEAREPLITASDAATVLGLNPWDTPLQLALRKRGEIPAKTETEAMRMGHVMQPVIAKLYADETTRPIVEVGDFTIHTCDAFPFAGATLDYQTGATLPGTDGFGALECKNVGARLADQWEEGAPLYVQVQLQFQLAVAGLSWGSVAALLGGSRFVWMDYEVNDRFTAHMMGKVEVFHAAIRNGNLPEATAADSDALRLLYPDHVEAKVVELPGEALDLDVAIAAAKASISSAEKMQSAAENKIKAMIGDAEFGVLPDGGRWSWKSSTRHYQPSPAKDVPTRTLRRLKA